MSIDGRHFVDALRSAEQQELIDGDAMLLSDMYRIMTPQAMGEGMRIDFGADRGSLQRVLTALQIEEMLHGDTDAVHMHNVLVITPGCQSFVGRAIPALEDLPLLDAIDALQADRWEAYKLHGLYGRVQVTQDQVTSQIVIANSGMQGSEKIADLTKPTLVVGATFRYLPDFDREEFGDDLAGYLSEAINSTRGMDTRVGKVAMRMVEYGEGLKMPSVAYFLKIGRPVGNMLGSLCDVGTYLPETYSVENGRVVTIPKPEYLE